MELTSRRVLGYMMIAVDIAIAPALGMAAINYTTGANSTNTIEIHSSDNNTITVSNNAVIDNDITIEANTGNNDASGNTGNATISTGDIHETVNVSNDFNQTAIALKPISAPSETAYSNSVTGFGSTNTVVSTVVKSSEVTVSNDISLENDLDLAANTGGNTANQNTGNATIDSGDIDISVNIKNIGNIVKVALGNVTVPENEGRGGGQQSAITELFPEIGGRGGGKEAELPRAGDNTFGICFGAALMFTTLLAIADMRKRHLTAMFLTNSRQQ